MKKTNNTGGTLLGKRILDLQEHGSPANISLTSQEYEILSNHFGKCLEIILDGTQSGIDNCAYKIKAKDYIGNISLPSLTLRINPKIKDLNFNYMVPLAYDLTKTFKESDFEYSLVRENTLFESLVKKLTDMIENLCRRGIVKTYYENDENIPYVKDKILFRENAVHNSILKHRTYCRYNEYGPDNIENRIIKYTLYYLT